MQPPDDFERLDPALRRILDPVPGVAERIARRALEVGRPAPRWRPAVAAALASAAAIVALLILVPPPGDRPAPAPVAGISITNVGGVIAVEDRSGNAAVVQIGEADASESMPEGQIFISMGESR
jgi:hypothetical protein